MVLGTPGSGKSFSVYGPFIEQMIAKGYSMFIYDYKFPDLTEIVYNEFRDNIRKYDVVPEFCVINFNDPTRSLRCNPLNPKYITDPADTTEIAELVMLNVNKAAVEKEDFFTLSAKVYLDALIWFLKLYEDGRYCTFPHVIELMAQDYKKVFSILSRYPELEAKIKPFSNALEGGAQDQLQGQIASAQIPLNKFVSPSLYWVLTGDDFTLDVNDPKHPKILCVGNDPDRQAIYGTTLALFTSRMFKLINHKGKLKCGVLLDELPTIFLKGLDNLIATARLFHIELYQRASAVRPLI
jgi:type IV secretory pathway TraG/TraD family ATPase VirD4